MILFNLFVLVCLAVFTNTVSENNDFVTSFRELNETLKRANEVVEYDDIKLLYEVKTTKQQFLGKSVKNEITDCIQKIWLPANDNVKIFTSLAMGCISNLREELISIFIRNSDQLNNKTFMKNFKLKISNCKKVGREVFDAMIKKLSEESQECLEEEKKK